MLDELLNTKDPNRKWPAEEMIQALGLPIRLAHSFSHHDDEPPRQLSLQELFDWIISDEDDPRPGYMISPMLDRRNFGMKGFREAVATLNTTDFQPSIKEIWKLKHEKMLRSLRVVGFERYKWSKPLTPAGMFYSRTRIGAEKMMREKANSALPSSGLNESHPCQMPRATKIGTVQKKIDKSGG